MRDCTPPRTLKAWKNLPSSWFPAFSVYNTASPGCAPTCIITNQRELTINGHRVTNERKPREPPQHEQGGSITIEPLQKLPPMPFQLTDPCPWDANHELPGWANKTRNLFSHQGPFRSLYAHVPQVANNRLTIPPLWVALSNSACSRLHFNHKCNIVLASTKSLSIPSSHENNLKRNENH